MHVTYFERNTLAKVSELNSNLQFVNKPFTIDNYVNVIHSFIRLTTMFFSTYSYTIYTLSHLISEHGTAAIIADDVYIIYFFFHTHKRVEK